MSRTTVKELLEAGVHFGHQARRWNPKMNRYILAKKNGIHLVDLRKTVTHFDAACDAAAQVASRGGRVLFVGTKKQAQEVVAEEARRSGQFFVNRRWLGGQLTNFKTIKGRIEKLKELDTAKEDGTYDRFSKKESLSMEREREKLENALGGIKEMKNLPDMIFVIDPKREKIAIAEANHLGIPVVALTDTNCDPAPIDYPVPANDDAAKAIRLLTGRFADAVIEGKSTMPAPAEKAPAEAKAPAREKGEKAPAKAKAPAKGKEEKAPAEAKAPARGKEEKAPAEAKAPAREKEEKAPAKAKAPAKGKEEKAPAKAKAPAKGKEEKAPAKAKAPAKGKEEKAPAEAKAPAKGKEEKAPAEAKAPAKEKAEKAPAKAPAKKAAPKADEKEEK